MAPELVAGGGYGGLIREKPYCAMGHGAGSRPVRPCLGSQPVISGPGSRPVRPDPCRWSMRQSQRSRPVRPIQGSRQVRPDPGSRLMRPDPGSRSVRPVPWARSMRLGLGPRPARPYPWAQPLRPYPWARPLKPGPGSRSLRPGRRDRARELTISISFLFVFSQYADQYMFYHSQSLPIDNLAIWRRFSKNLVIKDTYGARRPWGVLPHDVLWCFTTFSDSGTYKVAPRTKTNTKLTTNNTVILSLNYDFLICISDN